MLARTKPRDAYREADFDARLMGSSRENLVLFCIEDFIQTLGALEFAEMRGDRAARSRSLTRAITALTALELGVDRTAPMADSLLQFYGGAKLLLLDSIREIDLSRIAELRQDFRDVAVAFAA
ncbi:hypothetical protein GCM10022600_08900 [Qipengyuania pelagi]|jgi:flagellar protein FliS|uniref:Flagellin n=1 Tax=Qipengyuania pelagi TaxID=994320 RepID=A0A844Y7V9_9SPHN|nr:flagellar protein FliS [Qipengyuania pelagi]MXO54235.1 flagellin [Qipengyuania pelagi]